MGARMRKDPGGQRLLAARPDLAERLADREALSALPPGTLGRAYVEMCDRAGITPQGIVDASLAGGTDHDDTPPDVRFVEDRMRDTHDLWHVVTGYGTDVLGEISLLAFTYAQTGHPGVLVICALAFVYSVPGVTAMLREAYRRGKRATWLPAVAWETLLDRPLDEVRRELGVGAPPAYQPVTSTALREAGLIPGSRQGALS
jgi:ubiquinone biosynthesis protein COQ4